LRKSLSKSAELSTCSPLTFFRFQTSTQFVASQPLTAGNDLEEEAPPVEIRSEESRETNGAMPSFINVSQPDSKAARLKEKRRSIEEKYCSEEFQKSATRKSNRASSSRDFGEGAPFSEDLMVCFKQNGAL
jgi:hypothetical protein